jgi:hypothetical protein
MATRSTEGTLTFSQPFTLSAVDGPLPPGRYSVITEEEQLEGPSFAVWQRTSTLLFLPANSAPGKASEVVSVDAEELAVAAATDALRSP